ncbi:MAG TPA: hypothetical protein PLM81_01265 [Ginsengibacter sp.]|nr:hypothetical protein [Ginsengibacter sp.]HRP44420.1 hypothetical protein [Ginsengibacter sp.]
MKTNFILSIFVMVLFFMCSCGPTQQVPRQQDTTQYDSGVRKPSKKSAKPLPEEGGMQDPEILTPSSTNTKKKLEKPSPDPIQKVKKGKANELSSQTGKSNATSTLNPQPLPPVSDKVVKSKIARIKKNN